MSKRTRSQSVDETPVEDKEDGLKPQVVTLKSVKPEFPAISAVDAFGGRTEFRRIRCPPHRLTPLRQQWENIMTPVVEYLKLQIRFNPKNRSVELKTSELTEDQGAAQKGCDFIEAFMMGFEIQDAVALLRLDDLFIDSFVVTDVKMLHGDHLSRAIGRVAGQDGKTKYAIENATRTRIVMADQKVHIMGSFTNIKLARDGICNLIMGSPPGKVYNQMRNVARRLNERF
jgi:RNA-binding protein PNO1